MKIKVVCEGWLKDCCISELKNNPDKRYHIVSTKFTTDGFWHDAMNCFFFFPITGWQWFILRTLITILTMPISRSMIQLLEMPLNLLFVKKILGGFLFLGLLVIVKVKLQLLLVFSS